MSESNLISVSSVQQSPTVIDALPNSPEKDRLIAACRDYVSSRDVDTRLLGIQIKKEDPIKLAYNAYLSALKGLARAEFQKNADNPRANGILVFPQSVIPWKLKRDDTDLILGKAFVLAAREAGKSLPVDVVYRSGNSLWSKLFGIMFVRVSTAQQAEVITDYAKAQTGIYPKPEGYDCD